MPPFAVPSSLVRMTPVTSTASPNSLACRTPFWPVVASTDHQRLVWRVGHLLGDDAADLGQLGHQVGLGVQPAGGVDDHDVGAVLAAAGDGVERHRARIGALGAAHELAAGALATSAGAARRPPRGRCRRPPPAPSAERLLQVPGELADRRRLARPVDAHDQDHGRLGAQVDVVVAGPGEVGERSARRAVSGLPAARFRPSSASCSSRSTTFAVVRAPTSA